MNAKSIAKTLKGVLDSVIRKPAQKVSNVIMLYGLMNRPGLSTIMSVVNITRKMSEQGLPTEPNPDGTPNHMLIYSAIIVEEIFRALREDAKIDLVIGPNSLTIQATGASPTGPVTVAGTNINIGEGSGLIH